MFSSFVKDQYAVDGPVTFGILLRSVPTKVRLDPNFGVGVFWTNKAKSSFVFFICLKNNLPVLRATAGLPSFVSASVRSRGGNRLVLPTTRVALGWPAAGCWRWPERRQVTENRGDGNIRPTCERVALRWRGAGRSNRSNRKATLGSMMAMWMVRSSQSTRLRCVRLACISC